MAITELKPYLSNIADKLKSLLGITDKINAQDFVEKIDEVYEQGKKSQYDEFWDNYQKYGEREKYEGAFRCDLSINRGWNNVTFKPKYDIRPIGSAKQLFWAAEVEDYRPEALGVAIDLSRATDLYGAFYWNDTCKHIGVIDGSSITGYWGFQFLIDGCMKLETIEKFVFAQENKAYIEFSYCSKLREVRFEGTTCEKVILKDCSSLSYESITGEQGIVNALKDLTSTGTTLTLTLHANTKAKLSDADKATITQKGWTLA